MRVLCIGRVSYDICLPLNEFPIEGKKYKDITKVEGSSGGSGTAAYLLGRWGCETYIAGVVGNDLYGNRIKREYETLGVFTKFLEINYENDTIMNYVIVNSQKGTRTRISSDASKIRLTKNSFEIDTPNGIFLDGTEYSAASSALLRYKDAISVLSATENDKDTLDLCQKVKYIICPLEFAESITNVKVDSNNNQSYIQLFQGMKDKFQSQTIIITLGKKGVLYNVDYDVRMMHATKVEPKDPSGVGAIFKSAFLYAILGGRKHETAIKLANIAAGLSTTKIGINQSIFKFEEVETYAKNINESIY